MFILVNSRKTRRPGSTRSTSPHFGRPVIGGRAIHRNPRARCLCAAWICLQPLGFPLFFPAPRGGRPYALAAPRPCLSRLGQQGRCFMNSSACLFCRRLGHKAVARSLSVIAALASWPCLLMAWHGVVLGGGRATGQHDRGSRPDRLLVLSRRVLSQPVMRPGQPGRHSTCCSFCRL